MLGNEAQACEQVKVINTVKKIVVPASSVRGWVRYVGTIVTGPALTSVQLLARPKYV
jgi:hypothetical protein